MNIFQSTRPARGATSGDQSACDADVISIHAPREGRDLFVGANDPSLGKFQSTRPARGATLLAVRRSRKLNISIHAPREGRDDRL